MDPSHRFVDPRRMFSTDSGPPRDLWYLGGLLHLRATGADTGGAYALVEERLRGGFTTPLHVHRREDEAFHVVDGELTFWVGDEQRHAGPGEYVFLTRNRPHAFRVDSPTAHVFNIVSPAGLEHFFVDLGEPARALTLPPPPDGPPDVGAMARVLADYGVELVGPPPG
jgi:quercetin dioxygenase-like cupin family protein